MSELYLVHHGIKGQKWGVRRFQNPDGTLTEEGKRRARKDAESGNEWATSTYQPSSFKSSVLAGFYAATNNKKIGEMLDRSNNEDNVRWKAAQKSYEKISGVKITEMSNNANTKLAEKYVNEYIEQSKINEISNKVEYNKNLDMYEVKGINIGGKKKVDIWTWEDGANKDNFSKDSVKVIKSIQNYGIDKIDNDVQKLAVKVAEKYNDGSPINKKAIADNIYMYGISLHGEHDGNRMVTIHYEHNDMWYNNPFGDHSIDFECAVDKNGNLLWNKNNYSVNG